MELNLVEIRLLSPRGLWSLAPVRALIETLLLLMKSGHDENYGRMLVQQQMRLREKIRANLNMRIKAWVMQCPARIAWVRRSIGKVAIKHWRKNRLLDYALSKYFGDWKRKFPDGFTDKKQQKSQKRKPTSGYSARPYNWKAFALVKIINVSGFLYGHTTPKTGTTSKPNWTQPRVARTLKPIRFTPDELTPKLVAEADIEHAGNEARHLGTEHILPQDKRTLALPYMASPTDPLLDTKPP